MAAASPPRPRNPFRLLATYRNFRLFWVGQTISLVGSWMQTVAVGWTALELTNDPFMVGLVSAANTFPILLLSLPGGLVADRNSKLRVVRLAQFLMLGEAAALWALAATGHLTIGWLIALALVGGVLGAFEIPARQSLMVELVGKADLAPAIGLNSMGFNLARVLGPSVAALVIARLGVAWTFGLNALSYLAVLLGLALIRLEERRAAVRPGESALDGMRDAVRHVRATEPLPILLAIATIFSVLGVPIITLLPVVARDQLHLTADGYGGLMAMLGLGAVAGALSIAATGGGVERGRLFRRASFAFPLLLIVFGFVHTPWVNGLLLLAIGFTMILNNALVNARLQELVPDALRGRVLSLYVMVYVGGSPIGSFVGGWVARQWGVDWAIGGGAALMLTFAIWAFRAHPRLTAH
ncbi:MAG: MFS transporter [Gemmatimonadaceae bacterium]|nr:MFS transporter [Gemmatimonadaceae bacterium]